MMDGFDVFGIVMIAGMLIVFSAPNMISGEVTEIYNTDGIGVRIDATGGYEYIDIVEISESQLMQHDIEKGDHCTFKDHWGRMGFDHPHEIASIECRKPLKTEIE